MADTPHGYDQFDSMDPPGKPLPPEDYQDESTEHAMPLGTWGTFEDATGTDKQKKKKRLRNPFKSKPPKDKGETDKNPPDQRQELHKGEGTKGKKKESQSGLKSYQTTKEQESSTSATAELGIGEEKLQEGDKFSEKQWKIVVGLNTRFKKDLEERNTDIKTLQENLAEANATKKKDLEEKDANIKTLEDKLAEANTTMKKDFEEKDADICNLQEKNTTMKKDLEAKDAGIKKLHAKNATMKKDLEEKDADIKKLQEKLTEENATMKKDLEEREKKLAEENTTMKKDLEEKDADIKKLQEKLTEENATMKKDLEIRDTEIKTLQEMKKDLSEKEKKVAEDNTTMKKDLEKKETVIKTLQDKLAEAQNDYKTANQEIMRLYRVQDERVKSEIDRERLASDKIKDMEMNLYKLKMEKQHHSHLEDSGQYMIHKKEVQELDARLRDSQREFEIEMNHLKELLKKKEVELSRASKELTSQKIDIDRKSVTIAELKGEAGKFQERHDNTVSLFEKEKSAWSVQNQEQIRVLMESNSALKIQLQDRESKILSFEKQRHVRYNELLQAPDRNVLFQQQLQPSSTRALFGSVDRQKSTELQPKDCSQKLTMISMHSSAPSSLRETLPHVMPSEDNEDKPDEEEYTMAFESPHTSLTAEVVKSVTVVENNMTDAVKINIQQEVAVLQNKVKYLEDENNKLLHDLEVMNNEKMNLLMIKDKYLARTQEWVELQAKLDAVKEHEVDRKKEVSWNSGQVNQHQEKELQVLHEGLVGEENSDLRLVTETLNGEITSFKRRWERAMQDNAEHNLKEREILQKQKELEEENISLQRELAHLKEKLKHYQLDNDEDDCGVKKKATDMVGSLFGIEITDLDNKLRLKCSEIQVLSDCREKLETRLNGMEVERKRQHEQILQLVRVKANLSHELDHQQEAIQGYEELKKFLALKVSEVSGLQKEREALQIEITTMKDELEVRKVEVSIVKEDFKTERQDRERMASEISDLKGCWETERLECQEKVSIIKKDFETERKDRERMASEISDLKGCWETERQEWQDKLEHTQNYYASQINKLRGSWTEEKVKMVKQIKEVKIENEKLVLQQNKNKLEFEAKLFSAEAAHLKERKYCDSVRKEYDISVKKCDHLTESLESSRNQLHVSETLCKELKMNLDHVSTKKFKAEENLSQLQKDMEHRKVQYDSDMKDLQEKVDEALKDNENLQLDIVIARSEKESILKKSEEKQKKSEDEKDTLVSIQNGLNTKCQELQQQLTREKQTWAKKQQTYELLQRTLKNQLGGEKLEAEEEIAKLTRELSFKDQTLASCEQGLQYAKDQLQKIEYKLAKKESELKGKQIDNVTLKRELEQLCSGEMKEFDQGGAYQILVHEKDEIEQQRQEYERKYGNLMDAYSELRQLAMDHNLKLPKREQHVRYPSHRSRDDMNVREFNPAEHNMPLSQHDPGLVQSFSKRAATDYISRHGPPGNQLQQPMIYANPHPGSQSPYSRNRQGIHSPANVRHHQESTTENELIVGIDHDISEAAAHMEGRAIETSLVSIDDARPLDSNLICPLCGKQFRIGQIQNYRQHVDNCSK